MPEASVSWVQNLLNTILEGQGEFLKLYPEQRLQEGYGRAAQVIVEGPGGGVFDYCFTSQGLVPKPPEVPVKNTVWMTEDTLLDLITPDITTDELTQLVRQSSVETAALHLNPRLEFRTALAYGLVVVGGEKSDVDTEEWARLLESIIIKKAFPVVIRSLMSKAKEKKRGK